MKKTKIKKQTKEVKEEEKPLNKNIIIPEELAKAAYKGFCYGRNYEYNDKTFQSLDKNIKTYYYWEGYFVKEYLDSLDNIE